MFGQWAAGERLLGRGAAAGLWEAAVMGLRPRLEELFAEASPPAEEVNGRFWGACHGVQRDAAEYLLGHGADSNWVGWDDLTPLQAAERTAAERTNAERTADAVGLVAWLVSRGATPAPPAE